MTPRVSLSPHDTVYSICSEGDRFDAKGFPATEASPRSYHRQPIDPTIDNPSTTLEHRNLLALTGIWSPYYGFVSLGPDQIQALPGMQLSVMVHVPNDTPTTTYTGIKNYKLTFNKAIDPAQIKYTYPNAALYPNIDTVGRASEEGSVIRTDNPGDDPNDPLQKFKVEAYNLAYAPKDDGTYTVTIDVTYWCQGPPGPSYTKDETSTITYVVKAPKVNYWRLTDGNEGRRSDPYNNYAMVPFKLTYFDGGGLDSQSDPAAASSIGFTLDDPASTRRRHLGLWGEVDNTTGYTAHFGPIQILTNFYLHRTWADGSTDTKQFSNAVDTLEPTFYSDGMTSNIFAGHTSRLRPLETVEIPGEPPRTLYHPADTDSPAIKEDIIHTTRGRLIEMDVRMYFETYLAVQGGTNQSADNVYVPGLPIGLARVTWQLRGDLNWNGSSYTATSNPLGTWSVEGSIDRYLLEWSGSGQGYLGGHYQDDLSTLDRADRNMFSSAKRRYRGTRYGSITEIGNAPGFLAMVDPKVLEINLDEDPTRHRLRLVETVNTRSSRSPFSSYSLHKLYPSQVRLKPDPGVNRPRRLEIFMAPRFEGAVPRWS